MCVYYLTITCEDLKEVAANQSLRPPEKTEELSSVVYSRLIRGIGARYKQHRKIIGGKPSTKFIIVFYLFDSNT